MTEPRRRGFTMVELLTVIAIIVILMAVLLPVVARVRTQALVANTQQTMNQIQSACERYKNEQGAYPGPMPNSVFVGATGPTIQFNEGGTNTSGVLTMTENGVLGLCGGADASTGAVPIYKSESIGAGPMTHSPNANKRVRLNAYIEATANKNMPNVPWATTGKVGRPNMDSSIPEFEDKFQNPKPILYLRANVGAPGAVTDGTTSYPTGAASYQYDARWLSPYFDISTIDKTADNGFPDFKVDASSSSSVTATAGVVSYLANRTIPNTPRGNNAFILISAGPDGKFGTKDDLFVP